MHSDSAYADQSAEFVIDKSDVPAEGIKFSILDQDGKRVPTGEFIGQLRLGSEEFLPRGPQTHRSHEL